MMNCRKSVADLAPQEKQHFVDAVLALKGPARAPSKISVAVARGIRGGTPNRYDDSDEHPSDE